MVELTASKKTSSTAAYRVNVLNCTRESARGERIGRSQYGHRIVAVFNSLAYPFFLRNSPEKQRKRKDLLGGGGFLTFWSSSTPSLMLHIVHYLYLFPGNVALLVYLSAGMSADGIHLAWIRTPYKISKNNTFLHNMFNGLLRDRPFWIAWKTFELSV